jgi:hypothetical protein
MAKPGSPEWQEEINRQIAEHDRQQRDRDAEIDAELKRKAQEAADEAARKAAEEGK